MGRFSKLAFWRRSKSTKVEELQTSLQSPREARETAANVVEQGSAETSPSRLIVAPLSEPTQPFTVGERASRTSAPTSPDALSQHSAAATSMDAPVSATEATPVSPAAEATPVPLVAEAATAVSPAAASASEPIVFDVTPAPSVQHSARRVSFVEAECLSPPHKEPEQNKEWVNFGIQMTELLEEAKVKPGPATAAGLQATKWDRRVQALKALGAFLEQDTDVSMDKPGSTGVFGRGLQPLEKARKFRLCWQLLDHLMLDKVMPVRLESHALFRNSFELASGMSCVEPEEIKFALGVLLQHVLDRLGDSNLRLHESAKSCVLMAAELPNLLGLGAVLERLKAQLQNSKGSDRQKVHFGVLDTVASLVQRFPGHRGDDDIDDEADEEQDEPEHQLRPDAWTQYDISPFIVAGLCDSLGPRVRDIAVRIACSVHGTFGLEALEPMLAGLRTAKQQLLRDKFKEAEWEEGDDVSDGDEPAREMPDLFVCGTALSKPAPAVPVAPLAAEDDLMDGILEDAGMVFAGSALPAREPVLPGMADPMMDLEELEEQFMEQCFLEQQLAEFQELEGLGSLDLSGCRRGVEASKDDMVPLSCRSVSHLCDVSMSASITGC